MYKNFLREKRGTFAVWAAVASLPLVGAMSLAIDIAEYTRQKWSIRNALDATGIATARHFLAGEGDPAKLQAFAQNFFDANIKSYQRPITSVATLVPTAVAPRQDIELTATLAYTPFLRPAFLTIIRSGASPTLTYEAKTNVKLQNTLEVALVLDNSGSMDWRRTSASAKRIDILKEAADELIETLSMRAAYMKKVEKPVQFALVPFAASVNIGPQNRNAAWMDTLGQSPVHHENFIYPANIDATRQVRWLNGAYRKIGAGWPLDQINQPFTRFDLYDALRKRRSSSSRNLSTDPAASWQGCVEARPAPYNVDDTTPAHGDPASLFVPMFAPDEIGDTKRTKFHKRRTEYWTGSTYWSYWDWWPDVVGYRQLPDGKRNGPKRWYTDYSQLRASQMDVTKYFRPLPYNSSYANVAGAASRGPNERCTTNPVMELTDVSVSRGKAAVKAAVAAMRPLGGTNVAEGMAWGWRVLSSKEPFTGGRPEIEKGNDKVLIVLTDGENTYYNSSTDYAGNRSTYSNYGFTGKEYGSTGVTRLFYGIDDFSTRTASDGNFDENLFTESNYTAALNAHFKQLCANAKAQNIVVMTVGLDLASSGAQAEQIKAMKQCSSNSRFRKDSNGKPAKLFWNSTSSTLSDDFKKIGDELSNLRIVG